jgi:hypothetical protein
MHGALVSSRNKLNNDATHQQQQLAKARQAEKEKVREATKATTFMPPVSHEHSSEMLLTVVYML